MRIDIFIIGDEIRAIVAGEDSSLTEKNKKELMDEIIKKTSELDTLTICCVDEDVSFFIRADKTAYDNYYCLIRFDEGIQWNFWLNENDLIDLIKIGVFDEILESENNRFA